MSSYQIETVGADGTVVVKELGGSHGAYISFSGPSGTTTYNFDLPNTYTGELPGGISSQPSNDIFINPDPDNSSSASLGTGQTLHFQRTTDPDGNSYTYPDGSIAYDLIPTNTDLSGRSGTPVPVGMRLTVDQDGNQKLQVYAGAGVPGVASVELGFETNDNSDPNAPDTYYTIYPDGSYVKATHYEQIPGENFSGVYSEVYDTEGNIVGRYNTPTIPSYGIGNGRDAHDLINNLENIEDQSYQEEQEETGFWAWVGDWWDDFWGGAGKIFDYFFSPKPSPLVLDLDGDGIELTALDASSAHFDLNINGFAEATGWVSPDDALLALDVNGDGIINDGSELFGDQTGHDHGFLALAVHDDNGNGVIDASDAVFSDLVVWQDLNGDGISQNSYGINVNRMSARAINLNAANEIQTLQTRTAA